jgi:hypothetical protein
MILDSEKLDKLLNSGIIHKIYPMIDRIETWVEDDGDIEDTWYKIGIEIYLNDKSINKDNMYVKNFDPHYLVDKHVIDLLKFLSISKRDIEQVYISVFGPDGNLIYD